MKSFGLYPGEEAYCDEVHVRTPHLSILQGGKATKELQVTHLLVESANGAGGDNRGVHGSGCQHQRGVT